jgi:hypothetical protein
MCPLPKLALRRRCGDFDGGKARQCFAVLGDDDVLALRGFIDKARKAGLRFVEIDLPDHKLSLWQIGQVGQVSWSSRRVSGDGVRPCR